MFRRAALGAMAIVAMSALVARADPKDDVHAAVKKLADSPGYSWKTTTESAFGTNTSEGKTEKDGFTTYTMTMMQGDAVQVFLKGDKAAIKTPDGWKSKAELQKTAEGAEGFSPERFMLMILDNFETPAATLKEATEKTQSIQKKDDLYAADLAPDTAKEMLSFGRRPRAAASAPATAPAFPQMDIKNPKGTVKLWIKDGLVSKYEIHLQGTMSFNNNDNDVERTTTVEIKDVGSAKIDIPAEAKAKLAP